MAKTGLQARSAMTVMEILWRLSEEFRADGLAREADIFEIAGNLIEESFTTRELSEAVANAVLMFEEAKME